jgi:two-component system chemotaxis sensor kinase CheA
MEQDRRVEDTGRRATDRDNYQINTIRVEPRKLDTLMTLVGELTVEKTHIERHLSETEKVISLWEELSAAVEKSMVFKDDEHWATSAGKMVDVLDELRQAAFEDCSALNRITEGLEDGIRALRLLPLSTVFNLFKRSVRDLSRELSKEVNLVTEGGDVTADKHLIEMMKDPLMHLIRNAIYHGIETADQRLAQNKPATATIRLKGRRTTTHIVIEVEDDGKGLDTELIKSTALRRNLLQQDELDTMSREQIHALIFSSGFSTNSIVTDISGRGVGLNVVKSNVEQLKGNIEIESEPGQGSVFSINLPITLATTRIFLIVANGIKYALPIEFVRMVRYIADEEIFLVESRETVALNGEAISVSWLTDLLEYSAHSLENEGKLQPERKDTEKNPCLFLAKGDQQLGLFVDELLDELEVILKPPGAMLQRVRNVSGVTILGSGEICVVLNPLDLIKTVQNRSYAMTSTRKQAVDGEEGTKQKKPLILLAEDSITTRTQEKRILENAGYDVVTAVDGQMALKTLTTRPFDALISDVEMPNMNGLNLAENVRKLDAYKDFPIILVTSLCSEEDIKRGMEVGADAYITKANFNQKILLETLRRLI